MPLDTDMVEFVSKLAGKASLKDEFGKRQTQKKLLIDKAMEQLKDKKDGIRETMSKFYVQDAKGNKVFALDSRGQEYSIDTEGATKKGMGASGEQLKAVGEALKQVFDIVDELKSQGKDVFSPEELVNEVFTPLVREGILPDNLLIGKYSEVQQLLDKVYPSYKETLEEARQEKLNAKGKTVADYHGAGSKLDMLTAAGTKVSDKITRIKEKFNPLGTTSEEKERSFALVSETFSAVSTIKEGVESVQGLVSGEAIDNAKRFLSGMEKLRENETIFSDVAEKITKTLGVEKAGKVGEFISKVLMKAATAGDNALDKIDEFQEKDWVKIVEASLGTSEEVIQLGVETGLSAYEISELIKSTMEESAAKNEARKAAATVITTIDGVVSGVLSDVHPDVGRRASGLFAGAVKPADLAEAAVAEPVPEAQKIIDTLAAGFVEAFQACDPDATDDTFERVGIAAKKAFLAKVKATELGKEILADPASAFQSLRAPAEQAVRKALGLLKDEPSGDPSSATRLQEIVTNEESRQKLTKKLDEKNEEELLNQLERSEEDIAEYERQLVLMDEGGDLIAQERSIENLIARLKADRQQLELVASLGSGLLSLGNSGAEIAHAASKLSEQMVGQIAGPIKAAQLIIQLSVNAIQATERWKLWYKFRRDLERAQKARSVLSATVQNFYNNKKEQIAFHTIEDAMLAVQLAGAVLGSIPEPITLAVGKTLAAVGEAGEAGNKIAGMAFNEAMLREGWAVTKAALDAPGNRALGIKALRLNTTLAMHAIAWAGLEKRDPIAKMILNSCGLNEHTLADGGTTEKKVREYLETQLDEDRKFLDTEQIKTNWQPPKLELTAASWVVAVSRGVRDASPKLRKDNTDGITSALKRIKAHGALTTLRDKASTGDHAPLELDGFIKDAELVIQMLQAYKPCGEDGSPHTEMIAVETQFLQLANEYKLELSRVADENNKAIKQKL